MRKNAQLRRVLDGNDGFISGGNQIVGARTYKRKTPKWVLDDKKISALLLRSFPKLATDGNQREAAGRWAAVIHLYFRMKYTHAQVADEIGSTKEKIEYVIRSIYRASKGLRADGRGKLSGKRGRPKVKHAVLSSNQGK